MALQSVLILLADESVRPFVSQPASQPAGASLGRFVRSTDKRGSESCLFAVNTADCSSRAAISQESSRRQRCRASILPLIVAVAAAHRRQQQHFNRKAAADREESFLRFVVGVNSCSTESAASAAGDAPLDANPANRWQTQPCSTTTENRMCTCCLFLPASQSAGLLSLAVETTCG